MASNPSFGNIIMVGDVLVHSDIITRHFCCDLSVCRGKCCIEGDAGAPVTLDEVAQIENVLDTVWPMLSSAAQAEIDRHGVAYTDEEGDLVTSIVQGKDCVFTCYRDLPLPHHGTVRDCCLCALECAFREGRTQWPKLCGRICRCIGLYHGRTAAAAGSSVSKGSGSPEGKPQLCHKSADRHHQ